MTEHNKNKTAFNWHYPQHHHYLKPKSSHSHLDIGSWILDLPPFLRPLHATIVIVSPFCLFPFQWDKRWTMADQIHSRETSTGSGRPPQLTRKTVCKVSEEQEERVLGFFFFSLILNKFWVAKNLKRVLQMVTYLGLLGYIFVLYFFFF